MEEMDCYRISTKNGIDSSSLEALDLLQFSAAATYCITFISVTCLQKFCQVLLQLHLNATRPKN